jgi:D-sedoheptulose 7-phosphate isomerase
MHKQYITKLIDCLENTKFTIGDNIGQEVLMNEAIEDIINLFLEIKHQKRQVFFVGNGGSAGIASHMTADFLKNGGMRTQSLLEPPMITCLSNDYAYEHVFSKQLEILSQENDLVVAISSSGNSPSIVNAIHATRANGGKVITLSGFDEKNKIRQLGDYNIYVPIVHYGIVESIHNLLLQQVVDNILDRSVL